MDELYDLTPDLEALAEVIETHLSIDPPQVELVLSNAAGAIDE
jgi:hypothetical protein